VRYKASRYQYTSDYRPTVSKSEPPSFDLLSVVGMGIAIFSGGILVTQAFPNAQISREYLSLLAEGQQWIEVGLNTFGRFAVHLA